MDIPVEEDGAPDFEHINALDVKLFNEHMQALIDGEEVELPDYRFGNGRAEKGIPTIISANTPIIIEGIHALNDDLSFGIPKHQKFKIYIAPQFQINIDYHNPSVIPIFVCSAESFATKSIAERRRSVRSKCGRAYAGVSLNGFIPIRRDATTCIIPP